MITRILQYLVFLPLFTCFTLTAQIKIHRHLTPEDGLVQGQISSMLQDSKGYIWFGTFDGVSRWDGNNLMNIQTHNGLPASQVMDITQDKNGLIYFATYGGGVLVYNDGIIDTINTDDGLTTNNIIQIKVLRNGSILFAGDDGKITELNDGKLINWAEKVGFPEYDIFGICESSNGKLYFATENGLVIVNDKSYSIISTEDGLITNYLWSVNVDDKGTVYIGTNLGINKIVDGKVSTLTLNGKPFRHAVFKIHISEEGKVYYASNTGVLIEQNENLELISENNGLVFNDTWTLIQDINGMLYFGSNGKGVSIYNPNEKITNLDRNTGLQLENILSIKSDKKGNYYFATRKGLVKYRGNQFNLFTSNEGERSNIIESMLVTNKDEILLGTKGGLKVFQNGIFKPFVNKKELLENEIYSMAETESGDLYFGTRFGVYHVNDSRVKRLDYFDRLGSIYIMSILATDDQGIYFGSFDKGVFRLLNGNYTNITTSDKLSANLINCFHLRSDGTIWVGTHKGLNILKNNVVIDTIDVKDGLTNNVIADIHEDKGRIFVSTYNGLNIIESINDSFYIRNITYKDGLINNNCNQKASYLDEIGNLWIGTKTGITKYDSDNDIPVTVPPGIYFTGFEIFNQEYPLKKLEKTQELEYNQNYIKFIYTGINLSAPEKILYEYKLSDVDKEWVRTKENSVQYTSLDGGSYIFKVRARNEWGYWSEPVQLSFVINPVWWKTWWFTTLLIAFFIGGLLLTYKKRIENLEKETRAQEEFSKRLIQSEEEERKRIAAGLHDSLGQNLLIIKNRALLGIKNKKEEFLLEQLSEISSTASTTLDEVRQIAYNLHPYQLSRLGLTKAIRSIITNVKDTTSINFTEDLENIDNLFSKEAEINIYRIVQENINNIIKHSEAKNSSVKILREENSAKILIEDDGIGFDEENIYDENKKMKGFGLENIRKRIDLLKGEFSINSTNGTKVKIVIPVKAK